MAAFPTKSNEYEVRCTPDRFEEDCVIFRCSVAIGGAEKSGRGEWRELLPLEVPISLDDSDSFVELKREALQTYCNVLGHASKAASDLLAG